MKRPGCMEWDYGLKRYVYTPLESSEAGKLPIQNLTKRIDTPEETFEGALERHGRAWAILTRPRGRHD